MGLSAVSVFCYFMGVLDGLHFVFAECTAFLPVAFLFSCWDSSTGSLVLRFIISGFALFFEYCWVYCIICTVPAVAALYYGGCLSYCLSLVIWVRAVLSGVWEASRLVYINWS